MERLHHESEAGFTLLEMLVAVVILAVGLLGMAALQGTALRGNNLGSTSTEAGSLAMQRLEEFKNVTYDAVGPEGTSAAEEVVGASGIRYTRQVTIAFNSPVTNTKRVTVSVSWSAPTPHTVNLQTIISQ